MLLKSHNDGNSIIMNSNSNVNGQGDKNLVIDFDHPNDAIMLELGDTKEKLIDAISKSRENLHKLITAKRQLESNMISNQYDHSLKNASSNQG